jgi:hypothetical protein
MSYFVLCTFDLANCDNEEIYKIIKKHGQISFAGIGLILHRDYGLSEEDWWLWKNCEVGGYVSNLSKNGFIKNIAQKKVASEKLHQRKCGWL